MNHFTIARGRYQGGGAKESDKSMTIDIKKMKLNLSQQYEYRQLYINNWKMIDTRACFTIWNEASIGD